MTEITLKLVDGQELFFPSDKQWQILISGESLGDFLLPKRLISRLGNIELPLIKENDELELGLGYFGVRNNLLPYAILSKGEVLQRVSIEPLSCSNCEWKGWGASPLVPDIYLGISGDNNPKDLMDISKENFEIAKCPVCNNEFDRFFIWVSKL